MFAWGCNTIYGSSSMHFGHLHLKP